MEHMALSPAMIKVFVLLFLAVTLFVLDWVRVDIVGLLIMVLLPLSGVISAEEAISGFSSNAVVSIIAVMIIGAGLNRTGVMDLLARKIIRIAGKSETRIMVVVSGTVSLISSFMQNIGAAALFLPAVSKICKTLNLSPSRILMPMGFCAIIGGCLTLVGSSPLIMLNDLMKAWWTHNAAALNGAPFEPLGLFSVTPVGVALLLSALTYFILIGRFLLPATPKKEPEACPRLKLVDIYTPILDYALLRVPAHFSPQSLEKLAIGQRFHATVIGIFKKNLPPIFAPDRHTFIEAGDLVAVISSKENLKRLAAELKWNLEEYHHEFTKRSLVPEYGLVQGIVPPGSSLIGNTLEELDFRDRYHANVLALYRGDQVICENIAKQPLRAGDALLIWGPWEKLKKLHKNLDLVFTEVLKGEEEKPKKVIPALICLVGALTLAMVFQVKLSVALLTGALGMILLKVISIDDAYRAVDWMTIFLLAGLIPLGRAFEKTGAAHFIASQIINLAGDFSAITLLLTIGVLTSFFSLVASNVGATVLMVPLSMNLALETEFNPLLAGLTVAVAASNTFILPTHQVNALIMRPGGYRTKDYLRVGAGMSLIYLCVMCAVIYFFY